MKARPKSAQGGFTLLELTIAAGLTGLLGLMLATAWTAYGRAAAGLVARARLAQEADLAIRALSADLASGRAATAPGGRDRGRPTGLAIEGDGARLRISFDDPENPEGACAVVYEVREELRALPSNGATARRRKLVRWVESADPVTVLEAPRAVAWEAKSIGLAPAQGGWYEFRLTFGLPFLEDRDAGLTTERTYSLLAAIP